MVACADCGSSQKPGAAGLRLERGQPRASSLGTSKTHHDMRDAIAECDQSVAEFLHVRVRPFVGDSRRVHGSASADGRGGHLHGKPIFLRWAIMRERARMRYGAPGTMPSAKPRILECESASISPIGSKSGTSQGATMSMKTTSPREAKAACDLVPVASTTQPAATNSALVGVDNGPVTALPGKNGSIPATVRPTCWVMTDPPGAAPARLRLAPTPRAGRARGRRSHRRKAEVAARTANHVNAEGTQTGEPRWAH